jgi:hypothetical protein
MAIGKILLISIGSAVIISLIQDGLKYFFLKSKCQSNCHCIKFNYNEYKSNVNLKK